MVVVWPDTEALGRALTRERTQVVVVDLPAPMVVSCRVRGSGTLRLRYAAGKGLLPR
jgi:hypothetical protein